MNRAAPTATAVSFGTASRVAARCVGLEKRYGDVVALAGLDLEVPMGETLGLLGPNGAGKTTTVEILVGLRTADRGHVEVLGQTWGTGRNRPLRERIGVALQETQLTDKLTVDETLRLFRSLYRDSRPVEDVLDMLSLHDKRGARVEHLSGGQRQRLALGCALVGRPELLFLDEPTTGLDPQARLSVWEVVEAFRRGGGTTILTTHAMEEAHRLCHRVAIVDHGRVIAHDHPGALVASLDADQVVEFHVGAALTEDLRRRLEALEGVTGYTSRGESHVISVRSVVVLLPRLLTMLEEAHLPLERLATHEPTLEDVFVNLTGRGLRDA